MNPPLVSYASDWPAYIFLMENTDFLQFIYPSKSYTNPSTCKSVKEKLLCLCLKHDQFSKKTINVYYHSCIIIAVIKIQAELFKD